jgi:predicted DNA-binding transcriptional regulator AlpA
MTAVIHFKTSLHVNHHSKFPVQTVAARDDFQLLSKADLMSMFKVAPSTIWRWEKNGTIPPSFWVNGTKFWRASALSIWLDKKAKLD